MGSYGFFRDVNDVTLKPRLLQGVLSEKVLDAKRPIGRPSELVEKFKPIVDLVAVHRLLSETVPESTDPELVSIYNSTVNEWVDRILKLLASDVSDKSLAGVWLLGLTCRECSGNRFLASYVAWYTELLVLIQSSASSERVKLASCASLSDMLTRLAGFQNVKDGTVQAGKVIQPIVKLLNDDDAMAVWETAAHLLSTIINYFPSSVFRHYDSVESVIVLRMLAVNSSAKLQEKLAFCLALLPKSRGDEDLMLKRVLVSINILLDDALESPDGESKRQEVVSGLLPPGSSLPPLGEVSDKGGNRSRQMQMRIISTLVQSFCMMLSGLYPVQITLPVHTVLATIKRVLMVDGSVHPSLEPMTIPMQQEDVCAQLPMLHLYSLEILTAIVTGIDSQLLPYAADIARLLIWYLKKYTFPETRIQVYSIIRTLMVSMGAGMTLYLAEEVIRNASSDLNANDSLGRDSFKVPSLASAEPLQRCNKKRKHGNAVILLQAQQNTNNSAVEVAKDCSNLITVKIAALQALEALIRAGGALKPDGWRTKVDALVFVTSVNACRRGWVYGEKSKKSLATWTDYQLAALDALLASLIAPSRVRPPHLAQGLELFRDGSQLGGTKIAQFCSRALLSLEPLLHARALPLPDFSSPMMNHCGGLSSKPYGSIESGIPNLKAPSSDHAIGLTGNGVPDTSYDYLNDIYMEKDEDIQVPVSKSPKTQKFDKEVDIPPTNVVALTEQNVKASETAGNGDKMMIDSENEKQEDHVSRQGVTIFPAVSGSVAEMEQEKATSKDHSSSKLTDKIREATKRDVAEGKSKLKLSVDDPEYGSDWSLSTIELDQSSDSEADSASE
ncbi:hypothetical protein V2J09_002560 [Rumex salicifolius]